MGIPGLAQTLAAQQENLGVFYQAVGDRGGDRGVEQDVPQSENGVFVVIIVERFWLCRVEMS
jgi:hypothetical protein